MFLLPQQFSLYSLFLKTLPSILSTEALLPAFPNTTKPIDYGHMRLNTHARWWGNEQVKQTLSFRADMVECGRDGASMEHIMAWQCKRLQGHRDLFGFVALVWDDGSPFWGKWWIQGYRLYLFIKGKSTKCLVKSRGKKPPYRQGFGC